MKRLIWSVILAISLLAPISPAPAQGATCQFVLGFRALHDMIPNTVGDCLVDEHHNPSNGDGLQETTHGLLVWRKADNWTAFTDGYRTWVNGPYGVQQRLNTQRFPWEADAANFPPAASTNPPSSATSVQFTAVDGASPGRYASVSVQTSPNASCTIDYVTPHGTDSVAAGLVPKNADANGQISWVWLIGGRTYPGTGTVTVTCGGTSASASIDIP